MELKQRELKDEEKTNQGLNRTFYGIETVILCSSVSSLAVLIVPFMELKLFAMDRGTLRSSVLIVPFMELKLEFHGNYQNIIRWS